VDGVHGIDEGLRGQRADAPLDMRTDGADGEEPGGNGDAEGSGGGVSGEDGPGHDAENSGCGSRCQGAPGAIRSQGSFPGNHPCLKCHSTRARQRTLSLTINASRTAEAALAEALRERQREQLRAEIAQAFRALEEYVEKHGNPATELRKMFGGLDFDAT
jgi:post-segregation antitoxin (ccd killing protein)